MQLNNKKTAPRTAFTMVELVIVIAIIGILMAFLLPAIGGALKTARNATVTSEIKNFEKAIAEFKLKFGVEPPSGIILYEQPTSGSAPHWNTDTTTPGAGFPSRDLRRRQSVAFIRQAFPNFNFDQQRDFNGDGDSDDFVILKGSECLLFFLGGMSATEDASGNPISGPTGNVGTGTPVKWFPMGFSTDPANPFIRTGTRIGPFYEFDSGRIRDQSTAANRDMPEYLDPLPGQTSPYLYISSNGGRSYNVNGSFQHYELDLGVSSITSPTYAYLQSAASTEGTASAIPFNKNSYQIISPGLDTEYGTGGAYDRDDGFSGFDDQVQKDNITNFSGGVLDPS